MAVKEVYDGKGKERLADYKQPAVFALHIIFFGKQNYPDGFGKLLIISRIFFILGLGDKHMGQCVAALQLKQSVKIVRLISLNAKSFHHMHNHVVIIPSHVVVAVFFRTEKAADAELFHVGNGHGRFVTFHSLGNRDMGVESLLDVAFKMNETAHSVKQAPGNGKP